MMRTSDHCQRRYAGFLIRIGRILPCLALVTGPAAAQRISPAEVLLFETDHLARVAAPARLVYEFRKLSNVEPAFADQVQLDVTRQAGQVHAALRFLTGARQHPVPAVDNAHGNPVLLGFLEHDIAQMRRVTGGSVNYFRKRIRLALASKASVTMQSVLFRGKQMPAKVVRIEPYRDDPLHARFAAYAHKTYTFVLSEALPGGIYQIRTSLAAPASAATAASTATAANRATAASRTSAASRATPATPGSKATAVGEATPLGMATAASNAAPPSKVLLPITPIVAGTSLRGTTSTTAPAAANPTRPRSPVWPVLNETLTLSQVLPLRE
jgi:hypothetical protein